MNTDIVKRKLVQMLAPDFQFDISDRITVVSDIDHYKTSDPFVWAQKKGKMPNYYEVYWDDEWIVDFDEGMQPADVYIKFMKSFGQSYQSGKIRLNKFLADAENANDIKTLVQQQKVKDLKKQVTGAFEITNSGHEVNAEEQDLADKVSKELES